MNEEGLDDGPYLVKIDYADFDVQYNNPTDMLVVYLVIETYISRDSLGPPSKLLVDNPHRSFQMDGLARIE